MQQEMRQRLSLGAEPGRAQKRKAEEDHLVTTAPTSQPVLRWNELRKVPVAIEPDLRQPAKRSQRLRAARIAAQVACEREPRAASSLLHGIKR